MTTPIAIVSRSCVFPESLSPQTLWKNLLESRDLLSTPDKARWRTEPASAMQKEGWNHPAGYVRGFDSVFDPDDFELDSQLVRSLDPLFQWVLHTSKEAYHQINRADRGSLAVLLGNLSLPSEGLARWTEAVWKKSEKPQPLNRYMSGLPAHLIARALGRRADAFALDAACASSIYAIKLGCEKLRRKEADIVLAGAVNRADPLFLHIGFQALQALSPTGQSRPFHSGADGLVPTEGAAFIGLKRLDDAIEHGDEIAGVVHDAGLSNDARSDGLLVPAGEGQVRAIRAAYDEIGVAPEDISFIECHATGTPVGDGREINSLEEVFRPDREIPIGSHKSNMGHAITAAGMAGLLKILGAMEHATIPATIHCDDEIDELEEAPFRLVTKPEPWEAERKIAALSAFGFGGNNSHLVVEEWRGERDLFVGAELSADAANDDGVAVVGLGIVSGIATNREEFEEALLNPDNAEEFPLDEVELFLEELRFPPRDLSETLPQQLAIFRAACDAVDQAGRAGLDRERTGVFTGMQTDPDIVRHGVRARLDGDEVSRDLVAAPLTAAAVVGSLPNIVANRLNSHFDLGGFSFAVSAEEQSGDVALREACAAIRRGELDGALVGAVEMATSEPHAEADFGDGALSDAAVVLVVKRESTARAEGDEILATIDEAGVLSDDGERGIEVDLPRAHSAQGLLQIAAAIAVPEFALPRGGEARGISPTTELRTPALEAPDRMTAVRPQRRPIVTGAPLVYQVEYAGRKAAIVANSESEFDDKFARLKASIDTGCTLTAGIYPQQEALDGEVAQAFTGAAAAYRGMGRALCLAMPHLVENLEARFDSLDMATQWMFHPDEEAQPTPMDKLLAASVLSQLHSDLSTEFLGIDFDAAIGFSSGETNALFATGVWRDFDGMFGEFSESGAFTKYLGGSFELLREAWSEHLEDGEMPSWENWRVTGSRKAVQEAIADEPLVKLILINAPDDVTIGGHKPAICRVLDGLDGCIKSYIDYDIAVHCPEVEGFRSEWLDVHSREVHSTDLRLYSHAFGTSYEPTRQKVAEALLGQALNTVDFPSLVRGAWEDGIRVFVEHGPRTTLSPWISQILADRPHHVVSLDSGGDSTLRPVANAIAQLAMCGVDVDVERYNDYVESHRRRAPETLGRTISFPAQPKPVVFAAAPTEPADITVLPKAPPLPRVTAMSAGNPPADDVPAAGSHPAALPDYFRLQRQAFERYLEVVDAHSDVHRAFLERSRRGWELLDVQDGESSVEPEQSAPLFGREDLEIHASGDISEIFGPLFAEQDHFPRQVRMPEPPLLLADRVVDIDAEPGVVGTGTVWTETDIRPDSWYLFNGRIPPGVMIEAGQADLFLISWMGADFENKGERIYRLLGCELTYRGGLPTAGETLSYDIHIDDHAKQGDVRLFFFHYDCRTDSEVRLSVRNGQAGFFSDEELANSMGILWTPEKADFCGDARLDSPRVDTSLIPEKLAADDVEAFAAGRPTACFGEGYERLRCHRRTPNIHHGKMCLVGAVEELDVDGGVDGRGYLRTRYDISPESWFFDGHFKDDPCMPGTLMFEGGMQVMSLYMIAMGMTLDRDGWRFEPVSDVPYQLRCRGQATPSNKKLTYEIFVEEIIDGPEPRLVADILATVDGLKAFHCRGMQMRLVPDTPLVEELIVDGFPKRDRRALRQGDMIHDELAMRATGAGPAWLCMGDRYARFDGAARMPRLPAEPFQFLSRIVEADGVPGEPGPTPTVVAEYDIPSSAWYFEDAAAEVMPSAVIMEAALQVCGWLSLYSGVILDVDEPLYYRNLDGVATLHRQILPTDETLQTRTTLTRNSSSGGMTIQSFELQCTIGEELVYEVETTFGFFPQDALEDQVGIAVDDGERAQFSAESDFYVDLASPPDPDHAQLWPAESLRMIDAATGRWTEGEVLRFRAEKEIDPAEWFFKAHFYEDPVMPGSLGVEAMFQTLRFALIHEGHHRRFSNPRIDPIATGREISWTYRGQVLPESDRVTVIVDIHEIRELADETLALASADLWVDGLKIYAADQLAMVIGSAIGRSI